MPVQNQEPQPREEKIEMPTISDVSIIDSNTAEAKPVESGLERTICSPSLCGSKNLTVYRRTISKGRTVRPSMPARTTTSSTSCKGSPKGVVHFNGEAHAAEDGAGVLLAPGESARFEAARVGPGAAAHGHAEAAGRRRRRVTRRARVLLQPREAARLERRERRPCAPILRGVERAGCSTAAG